MNRNRRHRKNAMTSDDMLHLIFAGVAGVALGLIMGRKSSTPTSGMGEYFRSPAAGLGAYFHDPVNLPVSGLGSNYVRLR